jgi:hypothetical protein
MGAVVTLDGYIADINGDVGPLFDWCSNGDVEWKFDRVTHLLYEVESTTPQGQA